MTKVELCRAISEKTGVDQATTLLCVEGLMDCIKETLISKENVYLRGFGTFGLKVRAEKTARNISKNTTLVIAAHDIPYFKPCRDLMTSVAKAK